MMGLISLSEGDIERSEAFINEAAEYYEKFGYKWGIAFVSHLLGVVAQIKGELQSAAELQKKSLKLQRIIGFGDKSYFPSCLEALAGISLASNHPEEALRMLSAASGIRTNHLIPSPTSQQALVDNMLNVLKESMDPQTFKTMWESENKLSLDDAVTLALGEVV